jgi:hypothetical protein
MKDNIGKRQQKTIKNNISDNKKRQKNVKKYLSTNKAIYRKNQVNKNKPKY